MLLQATGQDAYRRQQRCSPAAGPAGTGGPWARLCSGCRWSMAQSCRRRCARAPSRADWQPPPWRPGPHAAALQWHLSAGKKNTKSHRSHGSDQYNEPPPFHHASATKSKGDPPTRGAQRCFAAQVCSEFRWKPSGKKKKKNYRQAKMLIHQLFHMQYLCYAVL